MMVLRTRPDGDRWCSSHCPARGGHAAAARHPQRAGDQEGPRMRDGVADATTSVRCHRSAATTATHWRTAQASAPKVTHWRSARAARVQAWAPVQSPVFRWRRRQPQPAYHHRHATRPVRSAPARQQEAAARQRRLPRRGQLRPQHAPRLRRRRRRRESPAAPRRRRPCDDGRQVRPHCRRQECRVLLLAPRPAPRQRAWQRRRHPSGGGQPREQEQPHEPDGRAFHAPTAPECGTPGHQSARSAGSGPGRPSSATWR